LDKGHNRTPVCPKAKNFNRSILLWQISFFVFDFRSFYAIFSAECAILLTRLNFLWQKSAHNYYFQQQEMRQIFV